MEIGKGPDDFSKEVERMVVLYQLPLLRLCYVYLRDEELARDAVQETFLKVCRYYHAFRQASSEKTWLFRIAINTCKDIRRSSWFRHVDRRVTLDKLPEPATPAENHEQTLTLEIMKLPAKYKEVALLCWYQGMTCTEAAETLQITHQAVSSRLNRARRKLRAALEESEGE